jgi:hypothetical protein
MLLKTNQTVLMRNNLIRFLLTYNLNFGFFTNILIRNVINCLDENKSDSKNNTQNF